MSPRDVFIATFGFGGLFLLIMWGSFGFFVRFKKRDDARRQRAKDYLETYKDKRP